MTDQELLKLSAKAYGYTSRDSVTRPGTVVIRAHDQWTPWNPLNDDGDALRLVADVGLDVYPRARTAGGQACVAVGTISHGRLAEVVDTIDIRRAVRLAVVQAAATLGKERGND